MPGTTPRIAEHRALGLAGRTRGVDHQRQVGEALAFEHGGDLRAIARLAFGADALEFVEGNHALAVLGRRVAQPLLLADNDALEPRQLPQRGQHLVGLLLVLANDDLDIGMGQHIGDLVARAGRVDADGDAADQAGAHLGQHPFEPVLGDHADMAALGQAERPQAQADMARAPVVLRPADRMPDAEILLPDRDHVGPQPGLLGQHLRQGLLGQRRGHESQRLRRL
jgi:hypothetical protein